MCKKMFKYFVFPLMFCATLFGGFGFYSTNTAQASELESRCTTGVPANVLMITRTTPLYSSSDLSKPKYYDLYNGNHVAATGKSSGSYIQVKHSVYTGWVLKSHTVQVGCER